MTTKAYVIASFLFSLWRILLLRWLVVLTRKLVVHRWVWCKDQWWVKSNETCWLVILFFLFGFKADYWICLDSTVLEGSKARDKKLEDILDRLISLSENCLKRICVCPFEVSLKDAVNTPLYCCWSWDEHIIISSPGGLNLKRDLKILESITRYLFFALLNVFEMKLKCLPPFLCWRQHIRKRSLNNCSNYCAVSYFT